MTLDECRAPVASVATAQIHPGLALVDGDGTQEHQVGLLYFPLRCWSTIIDTSLPTINQTPCHVREVAWSLPHTPVTVVPSPPPAQ